MSTHEPKGEGIEIVRQFFEDAFSTGNFDLIDEIVAEDAVAYDPTQPEPVRGPEGIKELITMYRSAFPDLSFEVQETVTDGEWVAVRWTSTGTHEGELMGIEPTGKKTAVEGIELDRIEDGKIVESRVSWDALGLLQQLGAVPESPAR